MRCFMLCCFGVGIEMFLSVNSFLCYLRTFNIIPPSFLPLHFHKKIYDLGMHMIPPSPFASNRKGGVGGVGGRRRRTPQMHTESTPPNVAAGAAPSPSVPLLEQRRSGEFQTNTRVQNDEEDLQKAIAANISKVRTRCQVRQS